MWRFFEKLKTRTGIWLRNPAPEHMYKENEAICGRYAYTTMFIAVFFTITKDGNNLCSSADVLIKKYSANTQFNNCHKK
jgi:hypothetical protein